MTLSDLLNVWKISSDPLLLSSLIVIYSSKHINHLEVEMKNSAAVSGMQHFDLSSRNLQLSSTGLH